MFSNHIWEKFFCWNNDKNCLTLWEILHLAFLVDSSWRKREENRVLARQSNCFNLIAMLISWMWLKYNKCLRSVLYGQQRTQFCLVRILSIIKLGYMLVDIHPQFNVLILHRLHTTNIPQKRGQDQCVWNLGRWFRFCHCDDVGIFVHRCVTRIVLLCEKYCISLFLLIHLEGKGKKTVLIKIYLRKSPCFCDCHTSLGGKVHHPEGYCMVMMSLIFCIHANVTEQKTNIHY